MKKYIIIFMMFFSLILTGCGKNHSKNVVQDFIKKYKNCHSYLLTGELSVHNNDDVYHYDVEVYYKKNDKYKVILTNTANQHQQIILKNDDGVYVLTPVLKKSFKFQSDWPYDNSQIYLLDALVNDIQKDKNAKVIEKDKQYVLETEVHYPNNSKLVNQKMFFNPNKSLKKVVVYDKDGIECMSIDFHRIQYSPKISSKEFLLDSIMSQEDSEEVEETGSLEDVIYPLFIPSGTKLVDEEKVKKENGNRVIMNYDGEKSFLLVEETADVFQEFTIIPSTGEPFLLMDTMGVMTNNSLSWSSGGVDFYLVSDVMSQVEMIEVAQSIGEITAMK